jgi:NADP-dependent aldehyde dehydrogenase
LARAGLFRAQWLRFNPLPVRSALAVLDALTGVLVAAVHGTADDPVAAALIAAMTRIAGRVVWNGWPTGVAVAAGQQHGGPWSATTSPLHTSVGTAALSRFVRPVTLQSLPSRLLPRVAA